MRIPLRQSRSKQAVEENISVVLSELLPLLRIEHCRLELVQFSAESGLLEVGIDGGCPDCSVSPATFSHAIAAHVKMRVPEVRDVRLTA